MEPHKNTGKTVAEILEQKQARIKNAPLAKGAPSWDDIRDLMWEDVTQRATESRPGYKTIKKLLEKSEYDK